MENNLKQTYYNKANDLFSRLMDEADEPETEATPEVDADEAPAEESPEQEEERGQAQKVEIFYNNLSKEAQTVLMDALRESLNAAENDEIATSKIEEALSKEPLVTLLADELIRKLNIQI